MQPKPGSIIISTNALDDTYFASTTVVITEYNTGGAVGFIINRLFAKRLNDLEEFKHIPFPLYEGGPVDQEHLFFIHRRPDLIEDGLSIGNGLYFGGNFEQAIDNISNKSITTDDLKIFIGYCGWNENELELELDEESWFIINNTQVLRSFEW